jgi:hypothetical protein
MALNPKVCLQSAEPSLPKKEFALLHSNPALDTPTFRVHGSRFARSIGFRVWRAPPPEDETLLPSNFALLGHSESAPHGVVSASGHRGDDERHSLGNLPVQGRVFRV